MSLNKEPHVRHFAFDMMAFGACCTPCTRAIFMFVTKLLVMHFFSTTLTGLDTAQPMLVIGIWN